MHQISLEQATSHSAMVFGDAMRGEEIVITDHDVPVLKVVPYEEQEKKERKAGRAIGMISYIADDFDETPQEPLSHEEILKRRRGAFGIWKDRTDLPDFEKMRRSRDLNWGE